MDDTELRGPRGAPGTGVRLAVRTGVTAVTAVTASAFAGEVALAVAFATEHDVVGRQIEVTEAQGLIDDAWAWVIDICERTIGVWGTIGSARITAARITAARFSAARISAASRIRIWAAWIRIIFARIRLRLAARIRRVDVTAAGHKVVVLTSPIARAELIRIAAGHGLHLVVVPTVPIARALLIPRGVKVTAAGHKVVVRTVPIARAEWIRKRVVAIAAGLKVVVRTVPIARAVPIRRGVKVTAAGLKVVVRTALIARAEWIRKRVEFAAGLKVVVRTVPIAWAVRIRRGVKVTAAGHRVVVLTLPIARAEWIRRVAIAAGHKVVVRTVPIARFTEQEIVGIILDWILDRIAADPRIEDPALRIAWILGCQGKLPSPDRGMATKNEGFKQIVVNWSCLVLQGVVCMVGVIFHNPSNSWHD